MNYTFTPAKRIQQMPEYIHARLGKEVKKVEEQTGRKVLNFGPGTPDVRPSKIYLEKLKEFIDDPKSHLYPGYNAIPILADALKKWYQTRFQVTDIQTDEVLPLLGEKDGLAHLPLALLNEGDEILVPNPGYMAFYEPTLLVGAKPVPYDLKEENNFKIDYKNLEQLVSEKTKAIWANFPSNPTGQVVTVEELEQLVAFAKNHNILLLYDNAYSEIAFDSFIAPSIFQVKGAKDISLEFCSFSKTYSFAGFRMGWVAGNKQALDALAKVKTQIDSGMMLPLQQLGTYVLTNQDKQWNSLMLESYQSRRDTIANYIKPLGLTFQIPKAALYIWAKIPDNEKTSEEYCLRLLREKQILFTPGNAFGTNGERYVRISYCINIDKIGEYFDK